MVAVAEAEDALLRPALLLVAPGSAERGIEAMFVERLLEPFGLPQVGVQRAVVERVDPLRLRVRILVDDEVDSGSAATASRKAYMSLNFQPVSTWSSGNGSGPGKKAFLAKCRRTDESLPIE